MSSIFLSFVPSRLTSPNVVEEGDSRRQRDQKPGKFQG